MGIVWNKIVEFITWLGENVAAREVVLESLKTMGIGMAGVFVVLMVFYLLVKVLLKVFPEKKEQQ